MSIMKYPNYLALGFIFLFCFISCSDKTQEITISGETMGTTYMVKLVEIDDQDYDYTALSKKLQTELDTINQLMSTYIPDSELSLFNQYQDTTPFRLSPQTFSVIESALQVSQKSDGAFDVTVGPLVNLYGFGPDPMLSDFPTDETINTIMEAVGYQLIELDPDHTTISKLHPKTYIDLSAIAKGYGVDQLCKILDEESFRQYLVEIGGEVRVKGLNANNRPWGIAIEKPVESGRQIQKIIRLENIAMATSGDYRNFYRVEGKRISHTIDPRTGKPVDHHLASVTVLHEACLWADAFATAINVLGPEEGFQFALDNDLDVFMLIRHPDDSITEKKTANFPAFD